MDHNWQSVREVFIAETVRKQVMEEIATADRTMLVADLIRNLKERLDIANRFRDDAHKRMNQLLAENRELRAALTARDSAGTNAAGSDGMLPTTPRRER